MARLPWQHPARRVRYDSKMTPDTPFSHFVDTYLGHQKNRIRSYQQVDVVLRHYKAAFGEKPLSQVKRLDVHNYVQERIAQGIKPGTINYELSILSAAFNYISTLYEIELPNPARNQRLTCNNQRLRYLEKDEAAQLLQATAGDLQLHDFITLALHTGCRKTELLKLQWKSVVLEHRFLVIQPETTKNRKRRILPLNQNATSALNNRQSEQNGEWVFSNPDGTRLEALDYRFRKARQKAAIEDFRIHDLRHTFASWLVSEGVELIKVRDLLGHSSITMTERYAHLIPNRLESAVAVLDRLL